MHPIVAIVGRPNVGKSRLFNRLVGQGRALVSDIPGVTRDRHYAPAEWAGREFIVVDTGGLDLGTAGDLEQRITKQSIRAIEDADVVICLFDGQDEPTSQDEEIVAKLRKVSRPIIFAVNKIDESSHEDRLTMYCRLGVSPIIAVSAEHGRGVDDILEEVVRRFPKEGTETLPPGDNTPVAIMGRPNVGKSTLINRLAGEDRVIVHEVPGTTRDAIDVAIDFEGGSYLFIDTAGIKRGWGVSERIERLTAMRSLRTIDRAEIVLQLIDAACGLTKQDLHLTGFIIGEGKGLILLVNKWDLVDANWAEYEKKLRCEMGALSNIPVFPISAKTGKNCLKIFEAAQKIKKGLGRKIKTSDLNKIVTKALAEHHLPVYRGKEVRIYYATQTGTHPPTFALFANYPAAVPYAYRRYLIGRIKEAMGIKGVPVRVVCRKK